MNLIEFLFALLKKFLGKFIDASRFGTLQLEAQKWDNDQKEGSIGQKVMKTSKIWYVQIILSFCFLFSLKTIADWLVSSPDDEEEDDDDDEDARMIAMIKAAKHSKPRKENSFYSEILNGK